MHKVFLHPLPVRVWHWVNAVGCVLMVLTGVQIRYVGLIDVLTFRTAVLIHNAIGFVIIANFLLWLFFYLFTDKKRTYLPEMNVMKLFRGSMEQAIYYAWGIFVGAPNPHHASLYHKFNPLQTLTYQVIMLLLLPIQCVTGILLLDVVRFSSWVNFVGGVRVVDTVHVLIFIVFVGYILMHSYLGTLGRTPGEHFRAMFTGYEEEEEEEGGHGS
jgi:thiosulfate reductase cytochrome b subunit